MKSQLLLKKIKDLYQESFEDILIKKKYSLKTVLLNAGVTSQKMFFIETGALRMFYLVDGKEITFRFFFENEAVASIESFLDQKPSQFTLETLENTTVYEISRTNLENIFTENPKLKEEFQFSALKRFIGFSEDLLSFIKDSPEQRYISLIENHPEIIQRVPQYYIASYLGITPVSLSRLRKRLTL